MGELIKAVRARGIKLMAEEKSILRNFFFPYIPKIIVYAFMAFVVPAPLLACAGSCSTKWIMPAGYTMLKYPGMYALTFPRMLAIFAIAYIASAVVLTGISALKKEPWHKKETSGKV